MIRRIATEGGIVYHASDLLARAGVPHGFSTRIGGVSPPPFDSLNLGNPAGDMQDDWGRIHVNYQRLQSAVGLSGRRRAWVHQVHGGAVAVAGKDAGFENGIKADAIVTDDRSRLAAVRVADCVPVLLSVADGSIVAAVHAGWRGVIAGVVQAAAVRVMRQAGARGEDLLAAIGPSIGRDAFEVGADVAGQFHQRFADAPGIVALNPPRRPTVDLRAAIRCQLVEVGLSDREIDISDSCTVGGRDEFFSHRRDAGITGRMAAVIGVR